MNKFEIELDDDYLAEIGRISVNFSLLEQVISFFIWNLISPDELFTTLLEYESTRSKNYRMVLEIMLSSRLGLEKKSGERLGQIVTAELSFNQKVNLLCSLHKEKVGNNEQFEVLSQTLKDAVHVEEKRNSIVHSLWAYLADDDNDEDLSRIKTTAKRKGLKQEIEKVTLGKLADIADEIAKVSFTLQISVLRFMVPHYRAEDDPRFDEL
jgi:hypothetical protein